MVSSYVNLEEFYSHGIFWVLQHLFVLVHRYGRRDVMLKSGILPTYSSPNLTLTVFFYFEHNVGLREGWVTSFPVSYTDPFFASSGPGRQARATSGPGKPRRAAPGYPSQQQTTGQMRQRTASSLHRFAATHKQPSLPRSGAQHLARGPANVNIQDQAFMRTPESGVCG